VDSYSGMVSSTINLGTSLLIAKSLTTPMLFERVQRGEK